MKIIQRKCMDYDKRYFSLKNRGEEKVGDGEISFIFSTVFVKMHYSQLFNQPLTMGESFNYFSQNLSYKLFNMKDFLNIQKCPNKYSAITEFKLFVESLKNNTNKTESYEKARVFANTIIRDNYAVKFFFFICVLYYY